MMSLFGSSPDSCMVSSSLSGLYSVFTVFRCNLVVEIYKTLPIGSLDAPRGLE